MKKSLLLKFVVLVMFFAGAVSSANAQVTTSAINGVIADGKGPLPGASVKAVHEPTGTVYGAVTNAEGRYAISNMRVGGPYTVTVTYVGFEAETFTDVRLKLGESFPINVKLGEDGKQLQEVVVRGRKSQIFNSKKTGAATNISKEQIESLPTLSRSLSDYYRLTPQANGNSFGGANPRYNNITIDGAVNNDVFAASSSAITPGSGANTQPISLDAIQEIQVVLAPYDITYGNFTGAGVNAVTRSGTNKFEGSVYAFGRNQNTVGKQPDGVKSGDFTDYQYGFRFGGPIVKDKLFFFVNGEMGRKKVPTTYGAGDPSALLTVAEAQDLASFVKTKYGYDVGGITSEPTETQNDKIFARLDWNINSKNQLMLRHNYITAFDDAFSRSTSNFKFGNNGGRNNSKQNITVLELRTKFNESLSNNFLAGFTTVRDARSTFGALFPHVQINNINGKSTNQVNFGSERSSTANQLDQDILEITDNFKIYAGNHTFTVGTHNEFFKFRNLFVNNRYGYWTFNSIQDFKDDKPLTGEATYPITDNPGEARFSAAQLSFYGQDEIQVSPEFKLTAGLRIDVPIFFDKPARNPLAETAFGYRTDITPKSRPLVSPRVGFNYDVFGNKTLQLRGGSGIFTGRVPFVWLSNQFTNNGVLFGTVNQRTPPPVKFVPDPNQQQTLGSSKVSTYELNLVDPNFRLPQTLRSNLAADIKLPAGIVATLEAIYNQSLNNVNYADINIKGRTGTLNPSLSGGNDTRPTYGGKVNSTVTNALLLSNTSKGSSYSLTAQLQKTFLFGLDASFAYTYGEAKEKNSGASSTARSNWQFNQIVLDPNNAPLSYSKFDIRHRVVGNLTYGVRYGKSKLFGTSLGIFYAGRSGEANTYLYNGDLNGDGSNANDLIYIPRNASEIKLVVIPAVPATPTTAEIPAIPVADQWNALNAYIENDSYLKSRRGKYAERFGARGPWEHAFDARLLQDIGGLIKGSANKIQLSVDVFNIGNLINKDWGRGYSIGNSNGATTLIGYSASNGGGFTFRAPNGNTIYGVDQIRSRWAAQFGVRYLFN
ncbi:TonB-dependent receptor [Pedobacter ginsengisoli]|uniref:TonB-dependent receptor n=1 Tax=Pedobacter ginsengisoli TaxID=363852 RepID=UPI002551C00A|nr:TonB-dependent receptor [Pedobacter ginsengisoli]